MRSDGLRGNIVAYEQLLKGSIPIVAPLLYKLFSESELNLFSKLLGGARTSLYCSIRMQRHMRHVEMRRIVQKTIVQNGLEQQLFLHMAHTFDVDARR